MYRQAFDQGLKNLQDQLLIVANMVDAAINRAIDALSQRDLESARQIIADDSKINERRFAIEADALALIATQQPMAGDLRTIAAILEINTELERIGDYAKGIAKISLLIGPQPLLKPLVDIPRMATKALDMLHRALDAFVRRDAEAARAIPLEDKEVDDLYDRVYRDLVAFIMRDPRTLDAATYLLWAAHNLERAADRVTNICERVVFTVTGQMAELDVDGPTRDTE